MGNKKTLYLLDAYALIYRAHFAFISRPLINSKGQNVSAVSGFVRTLWDIIKHKKPTHIGVAFDLKGPTFRHDMFPEYKANREAQPEDITFAVPIIREILKAFHIPILEKTGFEADDIIGTIAHKAEKEGFDVFMVTPDKDFGQLVTDKVKLYRPSRQGNDVEIQGPKEILEKWNIRRVDQVVDMLALQGDAVDNIPGIKGVGPKTAAKLLAQYDTVEGIIEHVDELKGSVKQKVASQKEQALLSKVLARIDTHVPLALDVDALHINEFNRPQLAKLFRDLEFKTLAKSILGEQPKVVQTSLFGEEAPASKAKAPSAKDDFPQGAPTKLNHIDSVKHDYHLVQTHQEIDHLIEILGQQSEICFDTETTNIDPNLAQLVGMSFAVRPHEAWYVPVSQNPKEAAELIKKFAQVFENEQITKIGQNLKYDAIVLRIAGSELKGPWWDTMIAHYLLEPEMRHNMDYLAETYLNYQTIKIETLIGKKGKNQGNMRDVPVEKVSDYAAEDADITLQLAAYFKPLLIENKLDDLFNKVECPLSKVLCDMEYEGVKIDMDFLKNYSHILAEKIKLVEKKIFAANDNRPFNLNAPRQIGTFLFEHLKIPYTKSKTKTGQYKTGEEILSELAEDHEIVKEILISRRLNKLKSTYVDALPKLVNPRTGRVHSSFNQALTATGRLSSNNPNLQNIPIKTEEGREIRKAFVPRDKDHILLAADYSQIELRLIAEISHEEAMLDAFAKNQDIHRATAAGVFGVPYDKVTADQRRKAKTVNFSIIYGAGATNLSKQLGIKRKEASELIKAYFEQFPNLKNYMAEIVEFARENGYVQTLIGRKRAIRDINSRNGMMRSMAERIAINTPVQGTAADLIKIAMNNIHQTFQELDIQSKMIMQVHDELVFDVLKSELDTIRPIIDEKMKSAMPNLKVPILVSMDVGENWLQAH
ncbi:MAG TPA: DNA polymerase I [Saprospiraceae bacterium]|nr:DNA polymerase I [Saprospiraceae bacterium]